MRIFNSYKQVPPDLQGGVVALGNFDGVHLGHREVISEAKEVAKGLNVPASVLTFSPHPRRFFRPDDNYFELTPGEGKIRFIEDLGVDALFSIKFDEKLAGMAAPEFVAKILAGGLKTKYVVAGYDFVFGKGRQGNLALLKSSGQEFGFGVSVVEAVSPNNKSLPAISSTAIRNHLRAGRLFLAYQLLGRPWEIEGEVVKGDQRGREIGFPTANVNPGEYLNPALGVYACWVKVAEERRLEWLPGVVNVGKRPTFQGNSVTVEVHLFDFDKDLYGKTLRVILAKFIRPEIKFDGFDAIRAQIQKDSHMARSTLLETTPGSVIKIGEEQ